MADDSTAESGASGSEPTIGDSTETGCSQSLLARGAEVVNGTYHFLDLVPKGRDEAGLPYTMAWVRLHDEYGR